MGRWRQMSLPPGRSVGWRAAGRRVASIHFALQPAPSQVARRPAGPTQFKSRTGHFGRPLQPGSQRPFVSGPAANVADLGRARPRPGAHYHELDGHRRRARGATSRGRPARNYRPPRQVHWVGRIWSTFGGSPWGWRAAQRDEVAEIAGRNCARAPATDLKSVSNCNFAVGEKDKISPLWFGMGVRAFNSNHLLSGAKCGR